MAGSSAASSRETVSPSGRLRARRAPWGLPGEEHWAYAKSQRNGRANELPGDEQYGQEWIDLLAVGVVLWRGI
jgi:hypothetical protein